MSTVSNPLLSITSNLPTVSNPFPSITSNLPTISNPFPSITSRQISNPLPSITSNLPTVSNPFPSITSNLPTISNPFPSMTSVPSGSMPITKTLNPLSTNLAQTRASKPSSNPTSVNSATRSGLNKLVLLLFV
ncbi:hypothetical protein EDD86DRAFT_8509 [Gorgonomyces haynaldii]|nr:hypothetical protein EDD86DRAFT_8509 [Gorgonomyces haynaldii]